ncbi:hypothetical protein CHS0354_041672 [Potamilus streckersoni]|uniref:PDZ domain-containing protein n=1 Tax=Potamilus streckersoni TaxID=2493646 RepID=A0AAE0VUK3_9BIVA|nr:hypothetical protein CHS0354_041672 [Potamilus streckersoni]
MATATIHLQRLDTSQPWGFKLQGGSDVGKPLHVAHVSPGSISGRAGLKIGDVILKIDKVDVSSFTHDDARGEMIRAGNKFDLTIQRYDANILRVINCNRTIERCDARYIAYYKPNELHNR